MGLIERYALDLADVETALGRPLRGDPGEGELAVVSALASARLGEVRRRLDRPEIGADLQALVVGHLKDAALLHRHEVALSARCSAFFSAQARRDGVSLRHALERWLEAAPTQSQAGDPPSGASL
jgi:hypothetical protein